MKWFLEEAPIKTCKIVQDEKLFAKKIVFYEILKSMSVKEIHEIQ